MRLGTCITPAALCLAMLIASLPVGAGIDGFYEVDGVEYYYATGELGRAAFGADPDAARLEPFDGCAWAKLRPEKDLGRIQTIATWQDRPLDVEFSRFTANGSLRGGIEEGVDVTASAPETYWPPVHADMAAWGTATVRWDGIPFADPATGRTTFAASWFLTEDGFRDDATGEIRDADGGPFRPGDARGRSDGREMHLQLASLPDATRADPLVSTVYWPSDPMVPLTPREEDHHQMLTFPNERFGGNGTLRIAATSMAPAGTTALTFTLLAPNGSAVDHVRLLPGVGAGADHETTFPLDALGAYAVEVRGNATLASYQVQMVQEPPARFAFDMWWDLVFPGHDGLLAKQACEARMQEEAFAGWIPPRVDPPGFPWRPVLFTLAAVLTVVVVGVSFLLAAKARDAWRSVSTGRR